MNDAGFGPMIYGYSRAQALADGVLVDVSEVARDAGFRVPVAITAAAWEECVAWDASDSARQLYQDEAGRLWDVVWMAMHAARTGQGARQAFQLRRVPRGGRGCLPRQITLHMTIGPGDAGEPVMTLLMPDEA